MPPTPPDAWTGGDVRPAKKLRDPTVRHEIRGGVIRRLPPLPAANDVGARGMPLDTPDLDREEFYGLGETEPEEQTIELPWWAWAGITVLCVGLVAFAVVSA
jgi:hypothetical protein